jgi:hypothetical protein
MTPERIAQIRGRLADLPCREWAICTEVGVDPPRSGIRLLRLAVPCQGDAAITTPEGGPVRRAVAELFANSGLDIADLLAALEAAEARAAAAEAEAGQLRAVFSQDFLAENDAARAVYERGVRDGREQVEEENAQAALADFDDDDDDDVAWWPDGHDDAEPDDDEPDDAPGAGPTPSLPEGLVLHEVAPSTLIQDGVLDMMAYIQEVAAKEMALPASVFPPVTLDAKSLAAKVKRPTGLLADIKGPTVTAAGRFPPPPEVPGGE